MKLDGIRVLDLSLFLPGPLMTQMMADHGAEVVKVEPIRGGEPNRELGLKRDGVSIWFANTHRGKKSIRLNLKTDEGREVLMRLAGQSDVMVEAFRPGVASRLGIGYEAICARSPKIVYCSISAFGQDGPYVGKPAHDLATEALSGVLSVNLGPDDRPAMPGIAAADMLAATISLSAVLMALLRRRDTGEGDYIDVAMLDSLMACMPNNLGPVFGEGRAPVPKDERSWGGNAMYNIYETKDGGHVVLGGSEVHFAANLLEKLGRPELVDYAKLPPGPGQEPLRSFIRETFKTKTRDEWVDWFEDVECAFAPVKTLREAADDPQIRAREMVVEDDRGWEHVGTPIKFLDEPGELNFDAPEVNADADAILTGLGYDDAQIAAMREAGIL